MSEKLKVQLEDEEGNIYYLHTDASIVYCSDGTTVEDKLNAKISIADIVNNTSIADNNKVPSAAVAKNLQDQISSINKLLAYETKEAVFNEGWTGKVEIRTYGFNFRIIYGRIERTSTDGIKWGETVCTLPNYSSIFWRMIPAFLVSGTIFNTFAISGTGKLNCYSPDFNNIKSTDVFQIFFTDHV